MDVAETGFFTGRMPDVLLNQWPTQSDIRLMKS